MTTTTAKRLVAATLCSCCFFSWSATATQVEALVRLEAALAQASETATVRERAFTEARDAAAVALKKERGRLSALEMRHAALLEAIDGATTRLVAAEQRMRDNARDLDELFEAARFEARDLRNTLLGSALNVQFPERNARLQALGARRGALSPDDFETLWLIMLGELTQAGNVARIDTVTTGDDPLSLTRIGTFALYGKTGVAQSNADGSVSLLQFLPRDLSEHAKRVAAHAGGLFDVVIDPMRGQLMVRQSLQPGAMDLFRQSGPIGAIIVMLGIAAGLLALQRYLALGRAMRQMRTTGGNVDHALRRLENDYVALRNARAEDVALALDDRIVDEAAVFERGQSLLRLIAALSPLLGLLGTVTAMIAMFRTIEVVGSGSPAHTAGAVALALVTTMLGLCVAIAVSLAHAVVAARSRALIGSLEIRVAELLGEHRRTAAASVGNA